MADKLDIRRVKILPTVLSPSTLYITRTVGKPGLMDLTMTGDTITEVRRILGVTEVREVVNEILETYVPKRALKSDTSDFATNAGAANTATSADKATKLAKTVTVKLQGDVTGSSQWDGSTDLTINTTGGGGGPGPAPTLPIVLYSDTFRDPEDTGDVFVMEGTPVEQSSIPGLTYGPDCEGAIKSSMGLVTGGSLEGNRAKVMFDTGEADHQYFGRIMYGIHFFLTPAIYNSQDNKVLSVDFGKGWKYGGFSFRFEKFVANGEKQLKFIYGLSGGKENSAIIPFNSGTYSVIARHDGNQVVIKLSSMPSDSETVWYFKYTDEEIEMGQDWSALYLDFPYYAEIDRVYMYGL